MEVRLIIGHLKSFFARWLPLMVIVGILIKDHGVVHYPSRLVVWGLALYFALIALRQGRESFQSLAHMAFFFWGLAFMFIVDSVEAKDLLSGELHTWLFAASSLMVGLSLAAGYSWAFPNNSKPLGPTA